MSLCSLSLPPKGLGTWGPVREFDLAVREFDLLLQKQAEDTLRCWMWPWDP